MRTSKVATPVRVGFVMHKMQVAGAEVLVKQIIERLSGNIDATVYCLDGLGELGQQLRDAGTPVVVLDRKPGLDLSVAKRLASDVKSRRIEVLHAHQYTPFFYSALSKIRGRSGVKVIFTEHGRHYPDVVSKKRRFANRYLLQHCCTAATACCDFSTRAVQDIEGFPSTFTLRNGVDLCGLPPRGTDDAQMDLRRQLGLDLYRPYAACVARFHPVKDHSTLIRAWARVHQQVPNAKLLLVGDGPERQNIESAIQTHAGSSDLASSIEFWGIRSDVASILRAVDCFTLTSVSEAASLTLLEAMASQCPAVVTDVGGNGEHVRDEVEGFLVPRADDSALATRLTQLLSDKSLCIEMGTAARQRVIADFELSDIIAKYRDLYLDCVNRSLPASESNTTRPLQVSHHAGHDNASSSPTCMVGTE
ncbi:putative glycosyltransferase EpsD [Rubripirellula amarantea]|uniref:Putative glycosyltransferase EpsD n=1 Tax=Rubripirellula amarantea TaxID=2527999 RepID=A0A5C5WWS6_9BACT|nr:glycosyltransferase [Rubripirellula amarantea]TWT54679.1 putative glycosyltransferase EpsD [Rubripirellula amarantea]